MINKKDKYVFDLLVEIRELGLKAEACPPNTIYVAKELIAYMSAMGIQADEILKKYEYHK